MTLRLLSWNIRKAVGLDWRRDPHRVARTIAEAAPDIVALQEADKRLGARPAALPREILAHIGLRALPDAPGRDSPSLGWHGNAILVREDWTAETIARLHLPGLEPRGALVARIDTPHGPLTLCATHLGLLRRSRTLQMNAIAEALAPHTESTVIAGDMNEWSRTQGFEPWRGLQMIDPGPSFHASRPTAHLDRILLGSHWRARRAGVLPGHRASDHLPVFADLTPA